MTAVVLDLLRIFFAWPVMTAVVALIFIHRFEPQIRARLAGAEAAMGSKALDRRVAAYAERKQLTHSEALERLVEAGLAANGEK